MGMNVIVSCYYAHAYNDQSHVWVFLVRILICSSLDIVVVVADCYPKYMEDIYNVYIYISLICFYLTIKSMFCNVNYDTWKSHIET